MPDQLRQFKPGTLWPLIVERTRTARQCGALQPIKTEAHVVEDRGVRFQVRVVSSLERKNAERFATAAERSAAARPNPFLPYEQDLFVADVSPTHVGLLNKYNVIDNHMLIITRAFEWQESPLSRADFEALWRCMVEYEALGFYNSGPVAGASQPHKHLQLVPLPLTDDAPAMPLETLVDATTDSPEDRIERLPFRHAFARLDPTRVRDAAAGGAYVHELYAAMLRRCGFDPQAPEIPPYNLLVTRRFMLFIPRSCERLETLSVNALGFAGSFFVPSQTGLEVIRRFGPMAVLEAVTFPQAS